MKTLKTLVRLTLLGCAACAAPSQAEDVITVDTRTVLRDISDNPIGINFNYLRDDPALRPAGSARLEEVIKEMGVRWIPYPGGEKSDWHFFAPPPFTQPAPQALSYYQKQLKDPLDFDEYVTALRQIGGIPYVVTSYDAWQRTGVVKEQYLAHAVGWVKYANVTKKYGIQYWEIGNENWHNRTATADEMAAVVTEFSHAMKAVDPTIKIGCSVNGAGWAETLLQKAGDALDFFSYSNYYSTHKGYADYRDREKPNLIQNGQSIAAVVARSQYKGRIEVIAAEFGAVDFTASVPIKEKWEGNDLGHAIALCDMAGQFLCEPRIKSAMFWNTRWMDDMIADRQCYALGPHNEIMPVGRAVAIWGQFLKKQMVATTNPPGTRNFASFDPGSGKLAVLVINKGTAPRQAKVVVNGANAVARVDTYRFTGTGPDDTKPTWSKLAAAAPATTLLDEVELPGTSITVLDVQTAPRQ